MNEMKIEPMYDNSSNNNTNNGNDPSSSVEIPAFGIKMKKIFKLYNGQNLQDIDIINDLRKPPKSRRYPSKEVKMKNNDNSSSTSSSPSSLNNDISYSDMPDSQSISNVLLSMKEGHPVESISNNTSMDSDGSGTDSTKVQYPKKRPGRKPKKKLIPDINGNEIKEEMMDYSMDQSNSQSFEDGNGNGKEDINTMNKRKRKYTKRTEENNSQNQIEENEKSNNNKNVRLRGKRINGKLNTELSNMSSTSTASSLNDSMISDDFNNGNKKEPKIMHTRISSFYTLTDEPKKISSNKTVDELTLSEKIDLLPNSLINLLKNGKYAIVKYHGSTECIGIQKCDTMLGKKELKKIKELQFNSNELETSKALRIKFENDSKKSQHRFLIITPSVWKHWDWFNLNNAEIDYTKQQ